MLWHILTVLSLLAGTAVLLPYVAVVAANIMAFAAPRTGSEPQWQVTLALSYLALSTAYPLGLLIAYVGAVIGWVTSRPALAFALSLFWAAWIAVCGALVAMFWLFE